jgi:hypothetical protein
VTEPLWGDPATPRAFSGTSKTITGLDVGCCATDSDPAARLGGRHRLYTSAGTGALLAGALGYVALVDPHNRASVYPPCPFKLLTGWNCPFCGGLRMTHDLLHGDLMAGVNDNVFLVFLLLGVPLVAIWGRLRRRHGRSALPIPAVLAITVAAILWTVLRNLPGFPLLPAVTG